MTGLSRIEAAYWLTLAFRLGGAGRRERNGLVLTASRRLQLGLLDLVQLDSASLPEPLGRFRATLEQLQAADGEVSGMAFLVDELMDRGVELLPITHGAYPAHLARTLKPEAAPTLLCVVGDAGLLAAPGVCVSGSRKAGEAGNAFARASGAALATAGVTLVTGLAAGPDREALAGSLDAGGRAIGVAPEGILMSRALRDAAVREGQMCVISEFHPKQRWMAGLAMARNKTLAGMSRALLVADCVSDGGTTNQVDVHRKAGLPVFVRRGEGEGALVGALARLPGVRGLLWDQGPVDLEPVLRPVGAAPDPVVASPLSAVPTSLTDGDALRRRRAELASAEARVAQCRIALQDAEGVAAQCRAAVAALEAQRPGGADVSTGESADVLVVGQTAASYEVSAASLEERVVALLHASTSPLRVAEVAERLGVSEAKVRASVKLLSADGRIAGIRDGRSTRYGPPERAGALLLHVVRGAASR